MVKRIFATSNSMATFSCSECGKTEQEDVSKFIKHEAQVKLKYKCSGCKHSSSVILERRLTIRKDVRLLGHIIQNSIRNAIMVEDLSKHGLRIKILQKTIVLEKNEMLQAEFILDDPKKSKVSKRIKVIKINSPTDISCEFYNKDHQGSFGKYFLFYFQ